MTWLNISSLLVLTVYLLVIQGQEKESEVYKIVDDAINSFNSTTQVFAAFDYTFNENADRYKMNEEEIDKLQLDYEDKNLTAIGSKLAFSFSEIKNNMHYLSTKIKEVCELTVRSEIRYQELLNLSHANSSSEHSINWRYEQYQKLVNTTLDLTGQVMNEFQEVMDMVEKTNRDVQILQDDFAKLSEIKINDLETKFKPGGEIDNQLKFEMFGKSLVPNTTAQGLAGNLRNSSISDVNTIKDSINRTKIYAQWLTDQIYTLKEIRKNNSLDSEDLKKIWREVGTDLKAALESQASFENSMGPKNMMAKLDSAVKTMKDICDEFENNVNIKDNSPKENPSQNAVTPVPGTEPNALLAAPPETAGEKKPSRR